MGRTLETPRTRRVVLRSLLGRIAAILVVFTLAVYVGIYMRTETLVMGAVEEQARTYVDFVIKARAWNARLGGVWVVKGPGVNTNPYLAELGVEADITCTDGTEMTLRNPALMTNEIAILLARDSGVNFHLIGATPVNPENAPDSWESAQLEAFSEGAAEAGGVVGSGESETYRYMVPLVVEDSCVGCHVQQGYEPGGPGGAISVSIPIDNVRTEMRVNAMGLGALGILTLIGILSLVYVMSARVVDRLEEAERQLEHLAVTDPLTSLWNRRHMMRRLKEEYERSRRQKHDLGLIILDLDHFKKVNDQFGHATGDLVLQAAAERMFGAIRDYDTLGRFGGEEFLVIVPETSSEDVLALADRIRIAVGTEPVTGAGQDVIVTASAGVAILDAGDLTPDAVLARADGALYAAKKMGRDRVVLGESADGTLT